MHLVQWKNSLPTRSSRISPSWSDDDEFWPWDDRDITLYETDDTVVAKANVSGVTPEEVEVTLDGDRLTIKASHTETDEEKKEQRVVYRQARKAHYLYNVTIPCPVKADKVEAVIENGTVTITLPKNEAAKPKKIEVTSKK